MSFHVRLSDIMEKFKDELSVFKKGENSFESGHVFKMDFDGTLGILRGEVWASMKKKKYSVEIQIGKEGNIQNAKCNCPRGEYQCHHMAALLINATKNISRTDAMCSWKSPASSNEKSQESVSSLYPAKEYKALNRAVSKEDKDFLLAELTSINRFSGFYWLLQEEPAPKAKKWKTMQDIIAVSSSVEAALIQATLSPEDVLQIANATIKQRNNSLWHQIRFGRLTASNFGAVISAIQRNRYPPSLFSSLLGKYNLEGVKSIQWGIDNEETAIKRFEEIKQLKVVPTGIWFHCSGVLGASPDGLIGDDAIIEVKCPFKHRSSSSSAIFEDKKYCLDDDKNLKTSHPYYHQIQGQLHILNRSLCFLVIWTTEEMLILEIEKDPSWEENIPKLICFFKEKLMPQLMNLSDS